MIVIVGLALWLFTPLGDLLDREVVVTQLEALRQSSWAFPVMVGLLACFTVIGAPITPFIIANGALFGAAGGLVANLLGTSIAGITGFFLARHLGRDLFVHLLRRTGLERIEHTLDHHGFWTLVRIRFLPIPFGIVNYAAGLTSMKLRRFVGASSVTMVPVLAVYSYLGHALVGVAAEEKTGLIWGAAAAVLTLFLLSWLPGRKLRREVATGLEDEGEPAP